MLDKVFQYIWLKHPGKAHDAMLSFAAIALIVCSIKLLLNDVIVTAGNTIINFGTADATAYAAFLGPTLWAYVNRKNKKEVPPAPQPTEPANADQV